MTSNIDWQALTDFALALAQASAQAILPYFRQENLIETKVNEVWDPVTAADRAGEAVIRQLIEKHYPDHGIIGEEYGKKETASDFNWILDPIDGTRAFVTGMPTWATLIGLNFLGKPVIGLMNQPFVGETFFANPQGSWVSNRGKLAKLQCRSHRPVQDWTLTTTAPELYRTAQEKAVLARMTSSVRLTRYGGDAYFFCLLAAGHIDVAMDARMQIYDIAPLIPIISGAGGEVATWEGEDPSEGGNIVAASSEETLSEALSLIKATL
jgi:histidinol phosphatase-like enzyme (inositol monophosphatase family)